MGESRTSGVSLLRRLSSEVEALVGRCQHLDLATWCSGSPKQVLIKQAVKCKSCEL